MDDCMAKHQKMLQIIHIDTDKVSLVFLEILSGKTTKEKMYIDNKCYVTTLFISK